MKIYSGGGYATTSPALCWLGWAVCHLLKPASVRPVL